MVSRRVLDRQDFVELARSKEPADEVFSRDNRLRLSPQDLEGHLDTIMKVAIEILDASAKPI
jgi:hypothetical protein